MTIQQIEDLFTSGGENKQKQAIEEAIALAKNDKDLQHNIEVIKASYLQLRNDAMKGILDDATQRTEMNKITNRFLLALGQLENLQNDDYNIDNPNLPKLPKLLTSPPFQAPVFIGRQEELQSVHDKFFAGENFLMLVNGQGGIGKTTFASKYWDKYQREYSHLAFLYVENGIANSLLSLAQVLGLEFTNETITQQIEKLVQTVSNLHKPCLLILDNANQEEDLNNNILHLRKCTNFHILLTSRLADSEYAEKYPLGTLSKELALELFKKHYPRHQNTEDILFESIYTAVGGNTLVIEVLAKNLALFNKLKTHYTLQSLYDDIRNKRLLQVTGKKEVAVAWQAKSKLNRAKPEEILAAMYDLSQLQESEIALLSVFAVLPAENIAFDVLEEILGKPQDLEDTLLSLSQKGWIEYNEAEASFKISPVVQQITKTKNQHRLPQDCQVLLEKLEFLFETDNTYLKNIDQNQAPRYYLLAQSVFLNMPEKSRALGSLGVYLGDYENSIGNLPKARESFEKAKAIFANIQDDYGFGACLERLGNTYTAIGNLEEASVFYGQCKDLQESMVVQNPDNKDYKNGLAISYEKLGSTQASLGNLTEALAFFEKYNELEKELFESFPEQVGFKNLLAISYQYLGRMHSEMDNLSEALGFFEKYNELEKELFESFPEQVGFKNGLAISYQHLGNTHSRLGNLSEALGFFEKYNELEKELSESFPEQVGFKDGLAISYQHLGETQASLGNLTEALAFFEKYNQLEKELYDSFPANVGFKNGLAISYHKLGDFHRNQNNKSEAKEYFLKCEKLLLELVEKSPNHKEFKDNLAEVQGDLKALG